MPHPTYTLYGHTADSAVIETVFIFGHVRIMAKSYYQLHHVCLSVCPHGTTRFPLGGFLWNLIFEYFVRGRPRKRRQRVDAGTGQTA